MVYGKSDNPRYIRGYHGCYDPLSYPLFFPNGEVGWNLSIPKVGAHSVINISHEEKELSEEGKMHFLMIIE